MLGNKSVSICWLKNGSSYKKVKILFRRILSVSWLWQILASLKWAIFSECELGIQRVQRGAISEGNCRRTELWGNVCEHRRKIAYGQVAMFGATVHASGGRLLRKRPNIKRGTCWCRPQRSPVLENHHRKVNRRFRFLEIVSLWIGALGGPRFAFFSSNLFDGLLTRSPAIIFCLFD